MGLLYTKFYMDFDEEYWDQISNDPVVFQTRTEGVTLEVEDASHNFYKLRFAKGGRIRVFRVTGRFRLTWDDGDVLD